MNRNFQVKHIQIITVVTVWAISSVSSVELTFELPDNEKQCFYQDIKKDVSAVLEFQVITGGRYDVDCKVEDPNGLVLYNERKKQYDSYEWKTQNEGVYKVCFSNEFSTITHKIVYFDFQYGDDDPLNAELNHATALSQMETYTVTTHEMLNAVIEYQTKFKLRETTGRIFANYLRERVQVWSIIQLVILAMVSVGQVLVLRSFFADRSLRSMPTKT